MASLKEQYLSFLKNNMRTIAVNKIEQQCCWINQEGVWEGFLNTKSTKLKIDSENFQKLNGYFASEFEEKFSHFLDLVKRFWFGLYTSTINTLRSVFWKRRFIKICGFIDFSCHMGIRVIFALSRIFADFSRQIPQKLPWPNCKIVNMPVSTVFVQ